MAVLLWDHVFLSPLPDEQTVRSDSFRSTAQLLWDAVAEPSSQTQGQAPFPGPSQDTAVLESVLLSAALQWAKAAEKLGEKGEGGWGSSVPDLSLITATPMCSFGSKPAKYKTICLYIHISRRPCRCLQTETGVV